MGMTKCKECKTEISTSAKACPKCGAVRKKTSFFTKMVAGFMAVIAGTVIYVSNKGNAEREAAAAKEAQRVAAMSPADRAELEAKKAAEAKAKAEREVVFQKAVSTARAVKAAAKDPSSFELVSLVVMADKSECLVFRARNSFNAIVTDQRAFLNGKSVDWNKHCGGKTGDDYSHARQAI